MKQTIVSIATTPEVKAALQKKAKQDRRTLNSYLGILLENAAFSENSQKAA